VSTPGYLAATPGAAVLDRTDLEVWKFSGRDPARMLSGVVTGRMPTVPTPLDESTSLGEATLHCVLTPKGRMVADLRLAAEAGIEDQPDWLGGDALYITLDRFADDPNLWAAYEPLFASIEPLTTVPLERGGEVTETVHIFRANDFKAVYPYPY